MPPPWGWTQLINVLPTYTQVRLCILFSFCGGALRRRAPLALGGFFVRSVRTCLIFNFWSASMGARCCVSGRAGVLSASKLSKHYIHIYIYIYIMVFASCRRSTSPNVICVMVVVLSASEITKRYVYIGFCVLTGSEGTKRYVYNGFCVDPA